MIIFYTNGCPKCQMLKQIMDNHDVQYEEVTDLAVIKATAKENNILSMPFAKVDDIIMNTTEFQQFLKDTALIKNKKKRTNNVF